MSIFTLSQVHWFVAEIRNAILPPNSIRHHDPNSFWIPRFFGQKKGWHLLKWKMGVGCNAVVGIIEVWSQVPVHQLGKNTLGTESVSWTKMIYHLLEHWCSSSVCPYTKVQQRVTLCCEPWYMACWATKEKHWSVKSLSVSSQLPHASAELRSSAMAGNTSRKWFWIRVPEFRGRVVWRPNCIGNLSRGREVSVTSRDQVSLRATWCPTDTSTSYALCSTSNRLLLVYLQCCLCAHVQGSRASGRSDTGDTGPPPKRGACANWYMEAHQMLESTCVGDIMNTGTSVCGGLARVHHCCRLHEHNSCSTSKVGDLLSRHRVCWHPWLNFRTHRSHFRQKSYLCGKPLSDTFVLYSPVMRTCHENFKLHCKSVPFYHPQPSKLNLLNSDHTLYFSGKLTLNTLIFSCHENFELYCIRLPFYTRHH